jgi:hypothetical protein
MIRNIESVSVAPPTPHRALANELFGNAAPICCQDATPATCSMAAAATTGCQVVPVSIN